MSIFTGTFQHLRFVLFYPKIGPDMYATHWLLFFKPFRLWFQQRKLRQIGAGAEIRPYCTINGTNRVEIGQNVIIPPGAILSADPANPDAMILIEDDVLLGPNVAIYSSTHHYRDISRPIRQQGMLGKTTRLKRGCWIGVNAVILPGVTVGQNAVVGANSVVTHDVPDFCVVAGAPARILKNLALLDEEMLSSPAPTDGPPARDCSGLRHSA